MKTALVVGGTAVTGGLIVQELEQRGFTVSLYHRGAHEVAGSDPREHIHGDPHFAESIERDLRGRRWDLVVATYGRIRLLAEAMRGRTGRLITVSTNSVSGSRTVEPAPGVPTGVDDPYGAPGDNRLLARVIETERAVLRLHEDRELVSTVIRYPYVYGPGGVPHGECHVIKRVLDGRRRWVMPGGGLGLSTRCAAPNAARTIALCVDKPDVAGGQIYAAADDRQYTFGEWTQMIAGLMGYQFEFVDVPWSLLPTVTGPQSTYGGNYGGAPQGGGPRSHVADWNIKAKVELGYADVVSPLEWLEPTVRYWTEHQPPIDDDENHPRPSQFDYALEDRILAWWDALPPAPDDLNSPGLIRSAYRHSYAHPKAGETTASETI